MGTEFNTEEQLLDEIVKLRESDSQLRLLYDEAPVGYYEVDAEGHLVRVNKTELELLGYTSEEMLGRYFWEFLEDEETVQHSFTKQVTGAWEPIRTYECIYRKKDGSHAPVLAESVPLKDDEGQITGFRATIHDISGYKQTEERLREASRLASVGELSSGVAHELNNPLASILMFTELLLDEDLPQSAQDDLQKIHSDVLRAGRIVDNLSTFARRRESRRQLADVADIVKKALDIKSYDLRVNNIEVSIEVSEDIPHTMVDEHQLLQAVLNILTNAEQALVERQSGGRISVTLDSSDDLIALTVADDGPGITPEHLPKIFDPFFTTREVGKGVGLGLSTSYGTVKQHGGDLWAESVLGEGATFYIELPVMAPYLYAESLEEAPAEDASRTKHILVVDDEPGIRTTLSRILASEGHQVDVADDGKVAWERVQSTDYDHILLDLKMPGMDGQQLYKLVKDSDERMASRIIFVTGDIAGLGTDEFISSIENPSLSKPFRRDDLRQVLLKSEQVKHD